MKNVAKSIEAVSNLAIIALAILLGAFLVKSSLLQGSRENTAPAIRSEERKLPKKGDLVKLPDVDWQRSNSTLLLALSNNCHFCTQSAPFYQRLVKEHGDAQLIALLPQSVDEGRSYLKRLGADIDDVRQVSFVLLRVSATPTLILVDKSGKVDDVWVGELPPEKEEEVVRRLRHEPTGM